jgi:hypothetical protein
MEQAGGGGLMFQAEFESIHVFYTLCIMLHVLHMISQLEGLLPKSLYLVALAGEVGKRARQIHFSMGDQMQTYQNWLDCLPIFSTNSPHTEPPELIF